MNKSILRQIVLVGLFLIPFVPFLVSSSFFFPFITSKAFAWRIIIEVVFAAWIVLISFVPEYRPKRSPILYALLTFIFIIGLADVCGVAPMKSLWSNFERMEGFVTILHLGAMFMVMSSVLKEREWAWWWNTTLAASFIMVLYCLSQLLGLATIHQGGVRVDGSLGNAAYLAVYMLFHSFLSMLFLVRSQGDKVRMWVYGVLGFLQLVVLYHTATRGAIFGFIGGLLLLALLNLRNKESNIMRKGSRIVVVGLLVLIGGFFLVRDASFVASSPVLSRFSSLNAASLKTEGRSFVWPMALEGIKERPLLGWGQENFNYVFNEHYDSRMYRLEPWFDRAHNIFLDWGIAGGLLGLGAYLALYGTLLYSLWKKSPSLSQSDRSIITGLIAAYFFHNLFVFDHLVSYILFFSLLAYVHAKTFSQGIEEKPRPINLYIAGGVGVTLLLVLYIVNIRPIMANAYLINGLQAAQTEGKQAEAHGYFEKAYNASYLGRSEIVEWISSSARNILTSNIPLADKESYFQFARKVIEKQANDFSQDTRYQFLAGAFFVETGLLNEASTYLVRAQTLTPKKQAILFQLGGVFLGQGKYDEALRVFKEAYDMAPEYQEAKIVYLVGALYAKDESLVQRLMQELPASVYARDERVTAALSATGRNKELEAILKSKLELERTNPDAYFSLAAHYLKLGNKNESIRILRSLIEAVPSTKTQVEGYIKGIQEGTIK